MQVIEIMLEFNENLVNMFIHTHTSICVQNAIVFQSYGFASRFILGRDLEGDNATPATYGQTFAAGAP